MKKKYKIILSIISILFFITLAISTSYGLWVSTHKDVELDSTTLNCFKIYYSDTDSIVMTNIKPVVNDDGKESSPYTLTITNICENTKELQLRLNITKENTVSLDGLTLTASGNIEHDLIRYNELTSTKTTDSNISQSKLIGLVKVEPNETVRTNIKLWFDERKAPNISADAIFSSKFELIDTESSIKPTFAETILSSNTTDEAKVANFTQVATTEDGLYIGSDNDGKTYYFRGNITNNYLEFAGLTWRIVRINGDKSIRVILENSIENNVYSQNQNAIDYTGLKYIYNNETINNDFTNTLENWYKINITDKGLDKYITTTTYCNDSNSTIDNYHTYFNSYSRIISKAPVLTCSQTSTDFGGIYKEKIGLISADEVASAGAVLGVANYNFYLNNGENYFTMSPAEYYNYRAYILYVTNTGSLATTETTSQIGIRPVLNIESTVSVSGNGTKENPYKLDLE